MGSENQSHFSLRFKVPNNGHTVNSDQTVLNIWNINNERFISINSILLGNFQVRLSVGTSQSFAYKDGWSWTFCYLGNKRYNIVSSVITLYWWLCMSNFPFSLIHCILYNLSSINCHVLLHSSKRQKGNTCISWHILSSCYDDFSTDAVDRKAKCGHFHFRKFCYAFWNDALSRRISPLMNTTWRIRVAYQQLTNTDFRDPILEMNVSFAFSLTTCIVTCSSKSDEMRSVTSGFSFSITVTWKSKVTQKPKRSMKSILLAFL